jgi:hypothetical protein
MFGEAGEDIMIGGSGDDTIFGGDDNDYLQGDNARMIYLVSVMISWTEKQAMTICVAASATIGLRGAPITTTWTEAREQTHYLAKAAPTFWQAETAMIPWQVIPRALP